MNFFIRSLVVFTMLSGISLAPCSAQKLYSPSWILLEQSREANIIMIFFSIVVAGGMIIFARVHYRLKMKFKEVMISHEQQTEQLKAHIQYLSDCRNKQRANYKNELQHKFSQSLELENVFLKNIYAHIEEMLIDSQLGASKLAEKNAMSLRTLNRKLNTMIGLSAGEVIKQYRLQKSLVFLKAGHNVSEAAYMVGFETPAYFSQCFKDHYNVSPKDYFAGFSCDK